MLAPKSKKQNNNLHDMWLLNEKPIKILFPVTYLCDTWFLHSLTEKTDCNRLNAEADMKIQPTSFIPDTKEILDTVKQWHSSH